MDGSTFVRDVRTRSLRAADAVIQRLRVQDRRRLLLMAGPPIVIALIALVWMLMSAGQVSTDDATVSAARAPISSTLRGRVVQVLVREDQQVHAGDVLFKLDDSDFRTAVMRAGSQASTSSARAAHLPAQLQSRATPSSRCTPL